MSSLDEQPYQYEPINEDGIIRLMALEPDDNLESPVRFDLVLKSLRDCVRDLTMSFTALSYVWGDANDTTKAYTNGGFIKVTPSLDTAVRHIRHQKHKLYLWADAVCINQAR